MATASVPFPRLVIAGVSSGVGKTTLACGVIAALRRRGLGVAAFKCGPDYLDPTYLSRAAGTPSQNLDGWLMGRAAVADSFAAAATGADVSIIEGVMGLYDGASPTSEEGSTAEIAKWLRAPVLLVADAGGMARSIAALVHGFRDFDRELNLAAVACNRIGSRGHLALLEQALAQSVPIIGGLERRPELAFGERHLGLRTADAESVPDSLLEAWATEVERGLDLDRLLALARAAPPLATTPSTSCPKFVPGFAASPKGEGRIETSSGASLALGTSLTWGETRNGVPVSPTSEAPHVAARCRIGVARDAAFHFYYADNLRRLERAGAELVFFSPLEAQQLPAVNGLYLGGGYPELHAARLSENRTLRAAIRDFAERGGPVYAECGGLMYLVDGIRTLEGTCHPMVGCLRGEAVLQERLAALGYVEIETLTETVLGPAGQRFRGHQFRYSKLDSAPDDSACSYRVLRRRDGASGLEGYRFRNVLASYVHAHWASNPELATHFVRACSEHASASPVPTPSCQR